MDGIGLCLLINKNMSESVNSLKFRLTSEYVHTIIDRLTRI